MALSAVCRSCRPGSSLFRALQAHQSYSQAVLNLNGRPLLSPAPRYTPIHPQISSLQTRTASFLHESAVPPSKRPTRETNRTSSPRTGERNEKISTLAIDHTALPLVAEEYTSQQSSSRSESDASKQGGSSRVRSRRRLILLSGIVLVPLIGRDILETVVPGMLGVIIFTLGNVKAAWKWVRS